MSLSKLLSSCSVTTEESADLVNGNCAGISSLVAFGVTEPIDCILSPHSRPLLVPGELVPASNQRSRTGELDQADPMLPSID